MLATPEIIRQANQQQTLAEALPRWLSEVPLYQGIAGLGLDGNTIEDTVGNLPLITKQDIRRDFPRNFLRAGQDLETLLEADLVELEHTSGTSSDRTSLLLGRGWWAEQERRALRLNGLINRVQTENPDARRVNLSSPSCNGDICYRGVPSQQDRTLGGTLVCSLSRHPWLWGERDLRRIVREVLEWRPVFLDLDPVYGIALARYCERNGIKLPGLEFIICSYEFLSVNHRRILERVFRVPVFNLYGSTETGHLLMENEQGEMVPSLETAMLETIAPDQQGVGELIVTTLTNDYMPLVRYRIGDLVCPLPRPFYSAYELHGRVADALVTAEGVVRTVRQVDACFAGLEGVAHYQLRQEAPDRYTLWFIPDGAKLPAAVIRELRGRLRDLLGSGTQLGFKRTDHLLSELSGKFRLTLPSPAGRF